VTDEAAKEGLELRYDLIRVAPNTVLAHRAVKLSADPGAAVDALFAAHFQRGVDVGDRDAIVEVLEQAGAGLDVEALDGGGAVEDVTADLRAAQEIGISGVPFWVAGGRVALSGAHEPALLRKLLEAGREQGG